MLAHAGLGQRAGEGTSPRACRCSARDAALAGWANGACESAAASPASAASSAYNSNISEATIRVAPCATVVPAVALDRPGRNYQPKDVCMKLHEYQAKELLAAAGAPIPRGIVVSSPAEAQQAF